MKLKVTFTEDPSSVAWASLGGDETWSLIQKMQERPHSFVGKFYKLAESSFPKGIVIALVQTAPLVHKFICLFEETKAVNNRWSDTPIQELKQEDVNFTLTALRCEIENEQ